LDGRFEAGSRRFPRSAETTVFPLGAAVKRAPAAAKPVLATQGRRDTKVSGLTAAGTYAFTLTVVDRTKVAKRDVTVTVVGKGAAAEPASGRSAPPSERAKGDRAIARGTLAEFREHP